MTESSGRTSNGLTVVIGAGPAGLTSALELGKLNLPAVVFEKGEVVGGLSRTVSHDGYRFDIGGHRFFTKIPAVRDLWFDLMGDDMLERPRMSRIYYRGRFFDYPLRPVNALTRLGPLEAVRIALSYGRARILPRRDDVSFEDWVVRRFGRRLFEIFFKSYTEKVWGIPCSEISADWAEQRIKNLDLVAAVRNALLGHGSNKGEVVPTLIDRFHYPTLGPGMMWERCRDRAAELGVQTTTGAEVLRVHHREGRIRGITVRHGERDDLVEADHVVSSMPLPALVRALDPGPPEAVLKAAERLRFRDFLTVVVMVDRDEVFPDNWIYIHAPEVKVGRIQNYKNWSPHMVPEPGKTSLGLEYFVQEGDALWISGDASLHDLAVRELEALGLVDGDTVVGSTVVRAPKAYPIYDEGYKQAVQTIRGWIDGIEGLQLIGRNGQHRYNNQDHSMLTGMLAARNIAGEQHDLWSINAEASYLEEITPSDQDRRFEDVLAGLFARYDPVALGAAVSLVWGGVVFLATAMVLLRGGDSVAPMLSLLGNYLLSYQVSWGGALLGWLEASVGGFAFGYLLAKLINRVVDGVARSVLAECRLKGLLETPTSVGPSSGTHPSV